MTEVARASAPDAGGAAGPTGAEYRVIDCYVHLGLPRFQSVEDCVTAMASMGVTKALVCPFETCPDISTVHRALRDWPGHFLGAGIPLGRDCTEILAVARSQLEAGFSALRLSDDDVTERGTVLDLLGSAHAFALVCGSNALTRSAPRLLAYLDRYDDGLVVAAHCGGPTDPTVLGGAGAVKDLFSHERFMVVLSRQGLFPQPMVRDWAAALVDVVGWDRLLWGSEAPVIYWRDEPISDAMAWAHQFKPEPRQAVAFYSGNAERYLFCRPLASPRPLELPVDPAAYQVQSPAPTWPHGLPLSTFLPARLVHGWLAWGGEARGPLRCYLEEVLDRALPQVLG